EISSRNGTEEGLVEFRIRAVPDDVCVEILDSSPGIPAGNPRPEQRLHLLHSGSNGVVVQIDSPDGVQPRRGPVPVEEMSSGATGQLTEPMVIRTEGVGESRRGKPFRPPLVIVDRRWLGRSRRLVQRRRRQSLCALCHAGDESFLWSQPRYG